MENLLILVYCLQMKISYCLKLYKSFLLISRRWLGAGVLPAAGASLGCLLLQIPLQRLPHRLGRNAGVLDIAAKGSYYSKVYQSNLSMHTFPTTYLSPAALQNVILGGL